MSTHPQHLSSVVCSWVCDLNRNLASTATPIGVVIGATYGDAGRADAAKADRQILVPRLGSQGTLWADPDGDITTRGTSRAEPRTNISTAAVLVVFSVALGFTRRRSVL